MGEEEGRMFSQQNQWLFSVVSAKEEGAVEKVRFIFPEE